MLIRTLGVDLGIQAAHMATLCDSRGEVVWSKRRTGNRHDELETLVDEIGECDELTVVMEPTRTAWVPVAAHFMVAGARVVLVSADRSADLRRCYAKHTKNDRVDWHVLARLPLLYPQGLHPIGGLGPAEPLRRAVRRRVKLVEWRLACGNASMPCWTCWVPATPRPWEGPCHPAPYCRFFNRKEAERHARGYPRRGLDPMACSMVQSLMSRGVDGADLLEIGGGVGAIQI